MTDTSELTSAERKEPESFGPENVRAKLQSHGGGRASALNGFLQCNPVITRGDVEDWLSEQRRLEEAQQRAILRWAQIAGWAGIISVVLTAVGIAVAVYLAK